MRLFAELAHPPVMRTWHDNVLLNNNKRWRTEKKTHIAIHAHVQCKHCFPSHEKWALSLFFQSCFFDAIFLPLRSRSITTADITYTFVPLWNLSCCSTCTYVNKEESACVKFVFAFFVRIKSYLYYIFFFSFLLPDSSWTNQTALWAVGLVCSIWQQRKLSFHGWLSLFYVSIEMKMKDNTFTKIDRRNCKLHDADNSFHWVLTHKISFSHHFRFFFERQVKSAGTRSFAWGCVFSIFGIT